MSEVVSLDAYRAGRSTLDDALAAVDRHPDLKDIDKAAISALARYATDEGFFALDQRERMAVTKLSRYRLNNALERVTDTELLRKVHHSRDLFRIGDEPDKALVERAYRLSEIHRGLEHLASFLEDTAAWSYEIAWLRPKVDRWAMCWPKISNEELLAGVKDLGRFNYLAFLEITENKAGEPKVRYQPTDFRNIRPAEPGGAA